MGLTTLRCYLTFSTRLTLPLMVQKTMVGKTNEAVARMTVQWHETAVVVFFYFYLFIFIFRSLCLLHGHAAKAMHFTYECPS